MQRSPSVKVTIVKKPRPSSQRSVKSECSSVKVTRVRSVTSRLVKNVEKTLVVENVDTNSTVHNESSTSSLSKKVERQATTVSVKPVSCSQPLKSITDKPSDRSEHCLAYPSKSYTIIPIQQKNLFNSNTATQLLDFSSMSFSKSKDAKINYSSLQSSTGDLRKIYTIGREQIDKNKKSQLCQKCSLRYCLVFGLIFSIIIGVTIALLVIVASLTMTTPTIISITSTTITMSTATSTSAATATTTSVTTTTAAATVTITSNTCTSSWMGITLIYHCDSCSEQFTYASLSYNYVAIANLTRISFALRRGSVYFGIDDVSIRDTATELLSNGGFETGNFSSWTHRVQSGSLALGSVQSTASGISYNGYTFAAYSGTYYYLGGALVNAEYLSQTFPSVIGHKYIFSFVYVFVGNGSLTSGDFLLSI